MKVINSQCQGSLINHYEDQIIDIVQQFAEPYQIVYINMATWLVTMRLSAAHKKVEKTFSIKTNISRKARKWHSITVRFNGQQETFRV